MRGLLERLEHGEILLSDGAIGSLLLARGLNTGECPEALNLESPEVLVDIAAQYREAGSDIVQTNTFGGTDLRLALHGLGGEVAAINRRAVELAREGVERADSLPTATGGRPDALIAGSCGPTGAVSRSLVDEEQDRVRDAFAEQIEALVSAGVHALFIETMTDPDEACLAIGAARQIAPDIPILASMTFDPTPKGLRTLSGASIPEAVRILSSSGADVVGSNCGHGSEAMVEVAAGLAECSDRPLVIQANAGLPELFDGAAIYRESAEIVAHRCEAMVELGVAVIGGCCGTTPEHIASLRAMLDRRAR